MSEDQKKALEQQLWNIANALRGKMNPDEFRDYILGFIFYKYLSEKMEIFANEILKQDKITFNEITSKTNQASEFLDAIKEEALEKLGYFLKPEELFTQVARRGQGDNDEVGQFDEAKTNFILEDLQKILLNIQLSTMGTESEEDFEDLFSDMDLNSQKLGKTPEARNATIAKILSHLNKIDFNLEQTELDVLGDAYEYLIGQFASGAGKKAGEFYTPQEVSMILAKIVTIGKHKLRSVYDPTCGSGSLLLRVAREVKDVTMFYGQEMNRTTYNLARMNMILHGVHYRDFDIKQEDTLEHPQHLEDLPFEAIVANPPFSANWSANPLFTSDDRFSQYGKLAPAGKADFAFVQHMIYHLAENGTMAVVLPHGVLFRGAAEQHIRRFLIENKNYLDAVIGLPANIFYGTSIPTCILVFKKCRDTPDDILFIDASNDFEKVKTQNVLREEHIDKIIDTYKERRVIEKYSYRASLKEVADNDYNLNIPRYVDTFEEEEPIDIQAVLREINELEAKRVELDREIAGYFEELGIGVLTTTNRCLMKKSAVNIPKVPNLRFPGFVGEWEVKRLGDVMDFKVTNSFSRENLSYEKGTIKNIHYGDIHTKFQTLFDLTKENVPCINPEISVVKISEESFCQKGDIVFADASEDLNDVGKSIEIINLNGEKLLSGLHTLLARPKENLFHLGFNGYLFKSNNIRIQIQRESQGSKVLSISTRRISKVELKYPNLSEQQKIASFLSLIDEKILTQNKIIEELKLLKTNLRNRLFEKVLNEENEVIFIKDILEYEQPTKYLVSDTNYLSDKSLIPVLTANKAFILGYTDESFGIYKQNECIIFDDFTLDFKYVNFPFKVKSSAIKILKPKPNVNLRFVFEYFSFLNIQSSEHKRHYISEIEPMGIAMPNSFTQNKTAKVLLKVDEKLAIERALFDLYSQQKQYLLKNLFI